MRDGGRRGRGCRAKLSIYSWFVLIGLLAAMATWTAAVDVRMGFSIATQQRSARAQHMRQIRRAGAKSLTARAQTAGIEALKLLPKLGDFNEDLRDLGVDDLRAVLRVQLAPDDVPPYRIPKATGIGFSNDRGVLMMEGLTGPQAPGTERGATDILRIARWRHGRQCRLRCLDRETQIGARNIPRDQPIIFTVSPSPLHSPNTKPAWRCRRKPISISSAVSPPLMRTRK